MAITPEQARAALKLSCKPKIDALEEFLDAKLGEVVPDDDGCIRIELPSGTEEHIMRFTMELYADKWYIQPFRDAEAPAHQPQPERLWMLKFQSMNRGNPMDR